MLSDVQTLNALHAIASTNWLTVRLEPQPMMTVNCKSTVSNKHC